MLTPVDRLTLYAVFGFISFCSLVLQTAEEATGWSLLGLSASFIGIWLEMHLWSDASDEQQS